MGVVFEFISSRMTSVVSIGHHCYAGQNVPSASNSYTCRNLFVGDIIQHGPSSRPNFTRATWQALIHAKRASIKPSPRRASTRLAPPGVYLTGINAVDHHHEGGGVFVWRGCVCYAYLIVEHVTSARGTAIPAVYPAKLACACERSLDRWALCCPW